MTPYCGVFDVAPIRPALIAPRRPVRLRILQRIPSRNALRPSAGVAVVTCLLFNLNGDDVPAGVGVPVFHL